MENNQVHALIYQIRDFSCPESIRIQAFDTLLEEFRFLLYAVTNHFFCTKKNRGIDFQDVLKDVQGVFYERLLIWDPKKKACFRHYISYAIFQYLDNLYGKFFPRDKRNCTVHLEEGIELSASTAGVKDTFSELHKYLKEEYGTLLTFIFIKYHDEGYTQEEIAVMVKRSQFWVCMSLKKIVKDLNKSFTEEEFTNKFFICI
jgi:hypothetical protein